QLFLKLLPPSFGGRDFCFEFFDLAIGELPFSARRLRGSQLVKGSLRSVRGGTSVRTVRRPCLLASPAQGIHVIRIVPGVEPPAGRLKGEDVRRCAVHEVSVVAYEEHRPFEFAERFLKRGP